MPESKPVTTLSSRRKIWANTCGLIVEDIARSLLAFIPNGLNQTYNHLLKALPLIGGVFAHKAVEPLLKLLTGITIGQALAIDIARFLFKPIGYVVGTLLGISAFTRTAKHPQYHGQIGKMAYRISGQAVGGTLLGMLLYCSINAFWPLPWGLAKGLSLGGLVGASIGLLSETALMMAVLAVEKANAAATRKNVERAKVLNHKLQRAAKSKAKSRILMHAQDVIQQMNGAQSQSDLQSFLKTEYDAIAVSTNKQIERHFNFLTERACHGDVKALKRLQALIPTKKSEGSGKNAFDIMLDRLFNTRSIFKLKDDVDTAYDRWRFDFLRTKAAS